MNKLKINVDRPKMSSKEISQQMNFEGILSSHKIMAKPFYKSTWFFGVTGLATISLIAASVYTLNKEGDELYRNIQIVDNVSATTDIETDLMHDNVIELKLNEPIKIEKPIDTKPTLKIVSTKSEKEIKTNNPIESQKESEEEVVESKPISKVANESINEIPKTFSFMDLHPRISGKIDGNITKDELMDDKGLTTNSDVEIISFQLHVVEGMSSKVFDSDGNKLNSEMKLAIENVNVGEEVYFEKIKGKATTGEVFRLSPIRYVMLN
jgi:hypothetical protein